MWLSRPHREAPTACLSLMALPAAMGCPPPPSHITDYCDSHLDYSWTHSRSLCRAELETPLVSSEM